jgi:hypothetical protein
MLRVCPCCNEKQIYIEAETRGTGIAYHGECECGGVINYDKDKNGNISRDYSTCPNGKKPYNY